MRQSFVASVALCAIGMAGLMAGPADASAPPRFTLNSAQHGAAQCLDAQPGGGAGGMNACNDSDGQLWEAYPTQGGKFFALRNIHSDDICLESGNGLDAADANGGAIYMADCGDFSGQNWYVEPVAGGYKLKSEFAGATKCLEGNSRTPGSAINGASFMNDCQDVSGQLWTIGNGSVVDGMPVGKD